MQIGGKTRKAHAPAKPQVVIQRSSGVNEYALLKMDEHSNTILTWVGDPYSASKYDSKYDAKFKTRFIEDIPEGRTFRVLEDKRAA